MEKENEYFGIRSTSEQVMAILILLMIAIVIGLIIAIILDSIRKDGNLHCVRIIEKIYRPSGYGTSEAYIFIFKGGNLSGRVDVTIEEYAGHDVNQDIHIVERISMLKSIIYKLKQL